MKVVVFIVDLIVLGGLVAVIVFVMGDTYTYGGIATKALIMGCVGGVYGLLRSIYRKWLIPSEDAEKTTVSNNK